MRRGSRWIDCRQAARKGEPRGRERVATSQMVKLFWGYGITTRSLLWSWLRHLIQRPPG